MSSKSPNFSSIRTVEKEEKSSFEEKKSIFLSFLFPVENLEQVQEHLKHIQKEYSDARHIVYAYTLQDLETGQLFQKFSDDGEPSGTAGKPIFDVILKEKFQNVLVISVRYFGGILLGAGGLTRAYTRSASDVLAQAKPCVYVPHLIFRLSLPYALFSSFEYYAQKNEIILEHLRYEERVYFELVLRTEQKNALELFLQELSHGHEQLLFIREELRRTQTSKIN